MTTPVRLTHRVSELVGCNRDEAEQYIRNGWVRVDGVVVEAPQHMVAGEHVELDSQARLEPVEPATLLLHKPAGVAMDAVPSLATPATHWADDPSGLRPLDRHFQRLTPLVALETDASGLVVLTQDGRVWRRLTEDGAQIEHEYIVEIDGDMGPYGMARLKAGVVVGNRSLPPCKVSWQNESRLRIAVKGSAPGNLRDMCGQVGLKVLSIRRLRIGRVALGKGPDGAMPPGQWRFLPPGEKF